ncbi:transglycosylase [Staphylococcus pasteuri]|uniref:aggregation-promoting factor C-terminal-like domain-containing protein n=1 Tax=Staphylococcus pasteuri TaxID=45972 RepID=UPI0034C6427D
MKKTFIASTLALTLGAAGYAVSGHEAHASETTNVDQAHLIDLAHNYPEQLNAQPVQAGAYDIHFVSGGFEYNFTSDGTNFSWNYQEVGSNASTTQASAQTSNTAAQSADYTTSYNQEASTQSVSSNQQSSNTNVEAVSAPTTSSNSSSSHNYSTKTTSYSAPSTSSASTSSASTGGSTKAQFLANGGTEAAWNAIVMPESGGNPNAVNPAGYRGLGQTKESWGSGSVASQTKGMLNYANSRYGSLSSAIAFRQSHGWW